MPTKEQQEAWKRQDDIWALEQARRQAEAGQIETNRLAWLEQAQREAAQGRAAWEGQYAQQIADADRGYNDFLSQDALARAGYDEARKQNVWNRDYQAAALRGNVNQDVLNRGVARGNIGTGMFNRGMVPITEQYNQGEATYAGNISAADQAKAAREASYRAALAGLGLENTTRLQGFDADLASINQQNAQKLQDYQNALADLDVYKAKNDYEIWARSQQTGSGGGGQPARSEPTTPATNPSTIYTHPAQQYLNNVQTNFGITTPYQVSAKKPAAKKPAAKKTTPDSYMRSQLGYY
jgi:hypothetical protein